MPRTRQVCLARRRKWIGSAHYCSVGVTVAMPVKGKPFFSCPTIANLYKSEDAGCLVNGLGRNHSVLLCERCVRCPWLAGGRC